MTTGIPPKRSDSIDSNTNVSYKHLARDEHKDVVCSEHKGYTKTYVYLKVTFIRGY